MAEGSLKNDEVVIELSDDARKARSAWLSQSTEVAHVTRYANWLQIATVVVIFVSIVAAALVVVWDLGFRVETISLTQAFVGIGIIGVGALLTRVLEYYERNAIWRGAQFSYADLYKSGMAFAQNLDRIIPGTWQAKNDIGWLQPSRLVLASSSGITRFAHLEFDVNSNQLLMRLPHESDSALKPINVDDVMQLRRKLVELIAKSSEEDLAGQAATAYTQRLLDALDALV